MALWMSGCATNRQGKTFLDNTPIDTEARAPVRFPDYFLLDGVELQDHGRIPNTQLIGAGMTMERDLSSVRSSFSDVLHRHEWDTEMMEMGKQSFRIIATHDGETVEIRGVQGTTSATTHIFLLYTP